MKISFPELFLAKLFQNHELDLFKFSALNSIWLMCDFSQSMKIYAPDIISKR